MQEEAELREENERLRTQLRELKLRLTEPEDILRAISDGEVDALVVSHPQGERIYSLRTADVLYRAMVEEMKEGAVVVDADGIILYCNPHFAGLLGVARETVVSASILTFFHDEQGLFSAYLRDESWGGARKEIVLLGGAGERIPAFAAINRIRLEDCDVFVFIVTDLRDEQRRQELIAESTRKDEFLAMLAHELRNPLAPIRNAMSLLRAPDLSKQSFEWSRQLIERQLNQLVRLLDDLLDIQRFTHGMIVLKTARTELGALIDAAVEAIRGSADLKSQVLVVERSPEPLIVLADSARLTQVISNLLVNAVKYSPEGSHVRVSWSRHEQQARIKVADDGIGMSRELLTRIFEPFVQGDRDLSRSQGGLGIGLTLVKRLVELHGGTVTASSKGPGKGSEFVVSIPLLESTVGAATSQPAKPLLRSRRTARKVLVVDDNEDSAVSLCMLLRLGGHQVESARDGAAALQLAQSLRPDVIVLDIGLPGMDGYEVARRIRAIENLAECRLVALTGYGRSEDRARTSAAGFSAHLVKPVDLDALLDVIESARNAGARA